MKGLIFTILALSLVLSAHAQQDENLWDLTINFEVLPSGVSVPPSFQIAGVTFFAHESSYPAYLPYPLIVDWTEHGRSYALRNEGLTVVLPMEAIRVEFALCPGASDVTVEALSSAGTLLSEQEVTNECEVVSIVSGLEPISVVRLTREDEIFSDHVASIAWLRAHFSTERVVDAGEDQFVATGELVRLSGTVLHPYKGIIEGMFDTRPCPRRHCTTDELPEFVGFWEQTGGTKVLLDADPPLFEAEFIAPDVNEVLTFRLTVTDTYDRGMASDEVRVFVQ